MFSLYSVLFFAGFSRVVFSNIEYPHQRFENWIKQFNIKFSDKDNSYYRIFENWIDNDKFIETVNFENRTYTLGHNVFSGMNSQDFLQFIRGKYSVNDKDTLLNQIREPQTLYSFVSLPISVNWVDAGAVTPVKDQGQCGSCWSFSTTGALEGAFFIKNNKLVSFSEQQLVECDHFGNGGKDHGCNGGLMDNAFTWINKNGGLCTEESFPYTSGNGINTKECSSTCQLVSGSKIQKYVDVVPNSDDAMMTALALQPVSIAIEADEREFQLYKSGVFTASCGTNLDHGVLAVGYGSQDGEDYYLVKNSWGVTWGENGYILLGRGNKYNDGKGQCGILMEASYPIV